jgi:lycopene cyclase domain-containing protein
VQAWPPSTALPSAPDVASVDFLVDPMDRFQYLILMGLCLLITLPLEWVFGARVWRRPRRLLGALLPVVAIFSLWDVVAIGRDHWTYSERYTTGVVARAAAGRGARVLRRDPDLLAADAGGRAFAARPRLDTRMPPWVSTPCGRWAEPSVSS